jgi:uncharacterized protein YbjT (DUF2867 family)
MIAITGATGNIGSKIALDLLSRGEKVRCIARGVKKLEMLAGKGADTTAFDLLDTGAMTKAFSGAEAVFVMIPPNYGAQDYGAYPKAVGESMVKAIDKAGVKAVVNLSSQGAHLPDKTGPIKGLHDQEKRLEKLRGVHVLHMRPAYFMENLLTNIDMIRAFNDGLIKPRRTPENTTETPFEEFAAAFAKILSGG